MRVFKKKKIMVIYLSLFSSIYKYTSLLSIEKHADLSVNMALVNRGFLHYRDMKKFLKNLLLRNCWSDFELFHRNVLWVTHYKNCSKNFDLPKNVALVNGGFLHYMDMKKFLKIFFLQNRFSDFEIISQECSLGDPFQKLFAKF